MQVSVYSNNPGFGPVFARRIVLPAVVLCVAVLAGACDGREDEVRSYAAPKDPAPSTAPATRAVDARPVGTQPPIPAAGDATANQAAADALPFQWTLPEGWKQDPQPRAMRVATVNVESDGKRGELIVTRFRAGGFGSLVDNLNRWRQQVGLPPVADEKEVKPETTTVGGREGKVYDFTGTAGADGNPAKRNRVVMVETPAGDVWFFRFFGPADLIERQRGQFDALLQSIKFQG
jgi:hypothetical protein